MNTRTSRHLLGRGAVLTLVITLAGALVTPAAGAVTMAQAPASSLTNLAHLDFLTEQVVVPNTPAHSTYRLDQEPAVGVLWVYADAKPDGSFANPDLAALARSAAAVRIRDGLQVVEAETGMMAGPATVVTPDPAWTGESRWSGQYVAAGAGSTVSWTLPAGEQPRLVQPVVELVPGSSARSIFTAGRTTLGKVRFGDLGLQGDAPSPTELIPIELCKTIGSAAITVSVSTAGGSGNIDALLVMPEVATLATEGNGHTLALLTSKSGTAENRALTLGGAGPVTTTSYDRNGRRLDEDHSTSSTLLVTVAAGGFTITTR